MHPTDCQIRRRRLVGARGKTTRIREMGVEDKRQISRFKKPGGVNYRAEKPEGLCTCAEMNTGMSGGDRKELMVVVVSSVL